MSDHDLDLITELINGRLSPDERRAALARVAADPELQSEYETQLAVSSLLRDAPPATMTAAERSDLRAALRQQLNLQDASTPVVVAPSRWQRWWAPVAGLAAAAAVIVGVVIVLPDGGSDDSLEFAAAQVETTVEASLSDEADVGESEDSVNDVEEAQTTTTASVSEELAPPTAAADALDGSVEAAGEPSAETLPHLPEVDLSTLGRAYDEGPAEFEDQLTKSSAVTESATSSDIGVCLDEAPGGADGASLEIVATATISDIDVVVVAVTPVSGDPYLIALDARTCEELASTRS
jgi:anti-sigma factor RsiW